MAFGMTGTRTQQLSQLPPKAVPGGLVTIPIMALCIVLWGSKAIPIRT